MAANNRALLGRMNGTMLHTVVLADDQKLQCVDIIRLPDIRKIQEALEVSRILFTMFGWKVKPAPNEVAEAAPALAGVTAAIGICGRSCWTRHMLRKVQQEVAKFELNSRDAFSQSYDTLTDVLNDVLHAARDYRNVSFYTLKIAKLMQRIRQLPDA
jgi:hypothetical protein